MSLCILDSMPTQIYTLSLHDALPIFVVIPSLNNPPRGPSCSARQFEDQGSTFPPASVQGIPWQIVTPRSEEHTSELQSRLHLVCRLLLEKKNATLLTANE